MNNNVNKEIIHSAQFENFYVSIIFLSLRVITFLLQGKVRLLDIDISY